MRLTAKTNKSILAHGCERPDEMGNCGCIHAEIHALARAGGYPAYAVISIAPCLPCAKALVFAGVKEIYFLKESRPGAWGEARPWLALAGAEWYQLCPDTGEVVAAGGQHRGSSTGPLRMAGTAQERQFTGPAGA